MGFGDESAPKQEGAYQRPKKPGGASWMVA